MKADKNDEAVLARSRLRLITPENAGKVLSRDIYWTVPFLDLFLEECDQRGAEEPLEAYRLAVHAPSLARFIGVGERPGEFSSLPQKISYEVLALAILGGICRRVGKITESEVNYEHAFRIGREHRISIEARAELERRFGILLLSQQEPGALDHIERSIELFSSIRHQDGLAESYLTRGNWQYSAQEPPFGAVDYARALESADQRTDRGRRAFKAALANLAYAITLNPGCSVVDHAKALEILQAAKKLLGGQRRSRSKVMLLAIEALLYKRLHFLRHAARLMSRAREGFRVLGLPYEFAQASLELAVIYLEDGERTLFEALRAETFEQFSRLSDDPKLIHSLERWHAAVRSPGELQQIGQSAFSRW